VTAAQPPPPVGTRFPLLRRPEYVRFWAADTVSMFGTYVTSVALAVLAVVDLGASGTEVGLLNAARWLPYLLFGLLAGAMVDRYRRLPILVGADLGRAALLGVIPLMAALDRLTMPLLIGLIAAFGALSLVYDAAHQSFLPRLVPHRLLTEANVRLEQTSAVAQTTGPLLAGWLIKIIGAPLAILVDAVSYLVSGLLLATLRTPESVDHGQPRNLRREVREGLSWVYRHRILAPLSITSHAWFLFNSMVTTVYVLFVIDELGIDAFGLGLTYTLSGVGAVLGATVAGWLGLRFGVGPTITACRWLTPVGYVLIPLVESGTVAMDLLCAAQFVFGVSIGIDSPIELAYRQVVTPDRLLGRMNATMRSMNRGAIVLGAPIGGILADALGNRTALWIAVAGLFGQAIAITASPFRNATLPPSTDLSRLPDTPETPDTGDRHAGHTRPERRTRATETPDTRG